MLVTNIGLIVRSVGLDTEFSSSMINRYKLVTIFRIMNLGRIENKT